MSICLMIIVFNFILLSSGKKSDYRNKQREVELARNKSKIIHLLQTNLKLNTFRPFSYATHFENQTQISFESWLRNNWLFKTLLLKRMKKASKSRKCFNKTKLLDQNKLIKKFNQINYSNNNQIKSSKYKYSTAKLSYSFNPISSLQDNKKEKNQITSINLTQLLLMREHNKINHKLAVLAEKFNLPVNSNDKKLPLITIKHDISEWIRSIDFLFEILLKLPQLVQQKIMKSTKTTNLCKLSQSEPLFEPSISMISSRILKPSRIKRASELLTNQTHQILIYESNENIDFYENAGATELHRLKRFTELQDAPEPLGMQNNIGNTGLNGMPGVMGAQGTSGFLGRTGVDGILGMKGYIGLPGKTGFHGILGLPGSPGFPGSIGNPGFTGQIGAIKALGSNDSFNQNESVGVPGVNGITGTVGLPGITGIRGSSGFTGMQGINGASGFFGDMGFPGIIGPIGVTGPKGTIGLPGPPGLNGNSLFINYSPYPQIAGSPSPPTIELLSSDKNQLSYYILPSAFVNGIYPDFNSNSNLSVFQINSTNLYPINNVIIIQVPTQIVMDCVPPPLPDSSNIESNFIWTVNGSAYFKQYSDRYHVSNDGRYLFIDGAELIQDGGTIFNCWVNVSGGGQLSNPSSDLTLNLTSFNGLTGSTGSTGFTGMTGPTGLTGFTGMTGTMGAIGATGSTGWMGAMGAIGRTGSNGMTGATGATGPPGFFGQAGATGPTLYILPNGTMVQQGPQGSTGRMGATGLQGLIGQMGPIGSKGDTGSPGNTGATGLPGNIGFTGPIGATGNIGPQGPIGPPGPAGISFSQDCNPILPYPTKAGRPMPPNIQILTPITNSKIKLNYKVNQSQSFTSTPSYNNNFKIYEFPINPNNFVPSPSNSPVTQGNPLVLECIPPPLPFAVQPTGILPAPVFHFTWTVNGSPLFRESSNGKIVFVATNFEGILNRYQLSDDNKYLLINPVNYHEGNGLRLNCLVTIDGWPQTSNPSQSVVLNVLQLAPCDFNTCNFGGRCQSINNSIAQCNCFDGYRNNDNSLNYNGYFNNRTLSNNDCNVRNGCYFGYCKNNGLCQATIGGNPLCLCPPSFYGKFCESNFTSAYSIPRPLFNMLTPNAGFIIGGDTVMLEGQHLAARLPQALFLVSSTYPNLFNVRVQNFSVFSGINTSSSSNVTDRISFITPPVPAYYVGFKLNAVLFFSGWTGSGGFNTGTYGIDTSSLYPSWFSISNTQNNGEGVNVTSLLNFVYSENPLILDFNPKNITADPINNQTISIIGYGFLSFTSMQIIINIFIVEVNKDLKNGITKNTNYVFLCNVINSTTALCPFPPVNLTTNTISKFNTDNNITQIMNLTPAQRTNFNGPVIQLNIGITINYVFNYYNDFSKSLPQKPIILVPLRPYIYSHNSLFFYNYNLYSQIDIDGENLESGVTLNSYTISLGNSICSTQQLTSNQLICLANLPAPNNEIAPYNQDQQQNVDYCSTYDNAYALFVNIHLNIDDNLVFFSRCMSTTFPTNSNIMIGLIVGLGLLFFLIIFACLAFFIYRHLKKKRSEKDTKELINIENMKKSLPTASLSSNLPSHLVSINDSSIDLRKFSSISTLPLKMNFKKKNGSVSENNTSISYLTKLSRSSDGGFSGMLSSSSGIVSNDDETCFNGDETIIKKNRIVSMMPYERCLNEPESYKRTLDNLENAGIYYVSSDPYEHTIEGSSDTYGSSI